jgi:uncharacterized protein
MAEDVNVRLVQRAYRTFGAGEVQAFLNLLAPDITWHLPEMSRVPFSGTWRGHEGVRKFLGTLASTQEVLEFQPERFVAQGETVIALGRFAMRVNSTGRTSRSEWAHVWTVRNGEITEFREYVDTAAVSAAHDASSRSSGRAQPARASNEPPGIQGHIADADKKARTGSENETVRNTPPAGDWNDLA